MLPFKSSGDAEMESFADGLGEEITTGLSRFRYLSVVASASAARLKGEAGDERALGAKLGARYVLEGSIRKGGSAIRVSAQLVDTETGAQLWAETYNRDLQTSSIFAVQDDIAARIVATVADSYGVLVHSMRAATRQKDDADLTPVEWQFQYFAYREQITPASTPRSRAGWSAWWSGTIGSRTCGPASRRSTSTNTRSVFRGATRPRSIAHWPPAAARWSSIGRTSSRSSRWRRCTSSAGTSRRLALRPSARWRSIRSTPTRSGSWGCRSCTRGEFERGTAIVRRAMELNANHAGWMHFAPLWDHFHKGEYEQALECANRVDVPGLFWPFLVMASACGHLGRRAEAEAAVRDLLALDPEFAAHARSNIESWHFASGLIEPLLEGLRKAGLSIPATDGSSDSPRRNGTVTAKPTRAESGTDSGQFAPTKVSGSRCCHSSTAARNAELAALADGLIRGDRHRPVALLLPPGDRAQLDLALRQ